MCAQLDLQVVSKKSQTEEMSSDFNTISWITWNEGL
jgi:hypothetical protein